MQENDFLIKKIKKKIFDSRKIKFFFKMLENYEILENLENIFFFEFVKLRKIEMYEI